MENFKLTDTYSDENYTCDFPIDLVILWCDDTPEFRQRRIYWQNKLGLQQDENIKPERFETVDELKYLLRSVEMFAPWINHIYIVTDNQVPDWLNLRNKKVTIVDHSKIIPQDILPIFNSVAIEAYIYRIPGLAEHFIYANDDMLFAQPVNPQFFFDKQGNPIVRLRTDFPFVDNNHARKVLLAYERVEQKYNIKFCNKYHLHHCIDAYRKSYYADAFDKFKAEYELTSQHKFRDDADMQRTGVSLVDIVEGRATLKLLDKQNTDSRVLWNCSDKQIKDNEQAKMVCVNIPSSQSREYLKYHYPRPSKFEKKSKQKPTLSIITVCYNIKDEIERTCQSIVKQTWQDFEWIVMDGGSTDGTVDVLKKYADRINILISEKDTGIYNAMNKGIKLAHGEWLNFMNGGDEYAVEDALEKVFKDNIYTANILQAEEEKYNPNGVLARIWQYKAPIDKLTFLDYSMAHQSAFYRRSLFKKYGMYDESYRFCADTEMNLRLVSAGEKVQLLDFIVGRFWLNGVTMDPQYKIPRRAEHVRFNRIYYTPLELATFEVQQQELQKKKMQELRRNLKQAKPTPKSAPKPAPKIKLQVPQKKSYKLFGTIPLISIEDK